MVKVQRVQSLPDTGLPMKEWVSGYMSIYVKASSYSA